MLLVITNATTTPAYGNAYLDGMDSNVPALQEMTQMGTIRVIQWQERKYAFLGGKMLQLTAHKVRRE